MHWKGSRAHALGYGGVLLAMSALAIFLCGCEDEKDDTDNPDTIFNSSSEGTTTDFLSSSTSTTQTTQDSTTLMSGSGSTSTTQTTQEGTTARPPPTTTTSYVEVRDEARDAQFLIQATFGPTRASLDAIQGMSYTDWIQNQMSVAAESHRAYYRSLASPRTAVATSAGNPRSPCEEGSRWAAFSLTRADVGKAVSISGSEMRVDGALRTEIDASYSGNGLTEPDTCTSILPDTNYWQSQDCDALNMQNENRCEGGDAIFTSIKACQQQCFDAGRRYAGDDCSPGWPGLGSYSGTICHVVEAVAGYVFLKADGNCDDLESAQAMLNPAIWFANQADAVDASTFSLSQVYPGVVVLTSTLSPCSLAVGSFIRSSGTFYLHDSRLELFDNTLSAPASPATDADRCPNVPKTFVNEETCVLRTTCAPMSVEDEGLFELSPAALEHMFTVEGLYVYVVRDLRTTTSPCGMLSRWRQMDCDSESCTATAGLSNDDEQAVVSSLARQDSWLRDIFPSCEAVPANAIVTVDGAYFQHVHENEYNVYDFSDWVTSHPGGQSHITQWATQPFELQFPAGHGMDRWEDNKGELTYLGRLNDVVDFAALPSNMRTDELFEALLDRSSSSSAVVEYFEACGSPGEVANTPSDGHHMAFFTECCDDIDVAFDTDQNTFKAAKGTVWLMKALHANDQLRQRMAWALSQILVLGETGLGNTNMHELWVNYYDILVRHAFGNYYELLREVTWNACMGEYLTYRKNKAFDNGGYYPDENYAREVMQLFTIGLYMLNPDGTVALDGGGNSISTYNNDDISDLARIFTGLDMQARRGNIEKHKGEHNYIDPMRMVPDWHDVYPKKDLLGGYIGDGYPLCSDLPVGAFLQQGAIFKFVGYRYSGNDAFVASPSSALYAELCSESSGACVFARKVVLAADVACFENECDMDTIRVVKVDTGYYEYVPPQCVYLAFYSGRMVHEAGSRWNNERWQHCADPATASAGASCCGGCTNNANSWMGTQGYTCENANTEWSQFSVSKCVLEDSWHSNKICQLACWDIGLGYDGDDCSLGAYTEHRACAYPQEFGRYSWAEARCSDEGLGICDERVEGLGDACALDSTHVWTSVACSLSVAIYEDGKITFWYDDVAKQNKFRVNWVADYPTAASCPSDCTVEVDACVCPAAVQTGAVFTSVPDADQFETLKIGSTPPATACFVCSGDVLAYYAVGSSSIDANTVFEKDGRYRMNKESLVTVGGKVFRNPPSFTATRRSATERGASAEVEALLQHLVDHPNTPPFIAYRLIQRFTTSNPSPAYVASVANAFRSGQHDGTVYSGQYGDLGAALAAVLLDSTARSPPASADVGALREPVLKLVHLMRAMEFAEPAQRQLAMPYLADVIGQEVFHSETVFNFYGVSFQPASFPGSIAAPEFQIFTTPWAIGFLNGIFSLIDQGVSSCDDGFGGACEKLVDYGGLSRAEGATPSDTIAELDLLLTGGRLSTSSDVVLNAYMEAPAEDRYKAAQRAIVMTPEFNVLGDPQISAPASTEQAASTPAPTPAATQPYKALVFLYLDGGVDSFNMLVPVQCALWDEYVAARGNIALSPSELHEITTVGQTCSQFGIHYKLGFVKELYDAGEAAFVSNVGSLVEPLTAETYGNGGQHCVGLYSHIDMVQGAQTLQCQVVGAAPRGAGGRMADALASLSYKTTSFSIAGTATWSTGFDTTVEIISKNDGAVRLNRYQEMASVVGNLTKQQSNNLFVEEYMQQLAYSIDSSELMGGYLDNVTLMTANYGTENKIEMEFHQVARLIATREARQAERDIFFVHFGGFDTHNEVKETLEEKFKELSDALEDFVGEMRAQGVWDQVTIMSSSDFGRTLHSNGKGSDHAWAGNYFVLGGDVNGGRIFNDFPATLTPGTGDQDAGRGRLIPKYPWETMVVPIATWMGVQESQHSAVFPNLGNFDASTHIISHDAFFRR